MASSKISLKLLVDTKSKKVLFAEAGKEFVDFVFSHLTLPIGAVVKLISSGNMQGSIGRLYQSVDNISAAYLQPGTDKSDLLQPKGLHPDSRELLLLQGGAGDGKSPPPLARFRMYTCAGRCVTVTMESGAQCPQCKQAMATEMAFVLPSAAAARADGGGGGGWWGFSPHLEAAVEVWNELKRSEHRERSCGFPFCCNVTGE